MGVPKFYRWISERYTKINEIVTDSALLPEFDHFYLDMNGIIHGCTHPSHMDISDVLSERDMMLGIMHYMDRLVSQIVKPKVSIFMAVDGVAPRAKLNQQRSRRFRSAKEMAESTKNDDSTAAANNSQKKSYFDSNCITPGTEFMAKVSETIKYFIAKKLKEDPSWRNLTVIFSGHEIPGEGEHKIMEHIRMMKSQPGYQPNTRHCIYGQDADLIMLGLVTHEPHFTILREVVDFSAGFTNRNALKQVMKFTKESDFQLLHLSILREYLELEFCQNYPAADLERVIDDFVFMTFLVGNDFLPHLNTLDIGEGALDLLFEVYKDQRTSWGDGNYLTSSGDISDPARLEAFLAVLGEKETEILTLREKDDVEFLKKKRRWNKRDGLPDDLPSDAEFKAEEAAKQNDYDTMIENLLAKNSDATFVDGWSPALADEKDFKGRYYFEKLKLTPLDIEAHHALRQSYIEGLMWCLAYYYRGCISWGWFFPYHYGPMLSDLRQLPEMFSRIKFEVGQPILPFQQLMSCLPPLSSALVPKPYRLLMTSPDSPILDFYPTDFEVDMNGKKNPWEGVNLLPFIEINRLLAAIHEHCPDNKLTPAERTRNKKGNIYCYTADVTCNDTIKAPHKGIGLSDIPNCHSRVTILPEYNSQGVTFKPELIPGTKIPYPGFPSLKVVPIASAELVPIRVNVFGMPSKYPTMVLKLHEVPQIPSAEELAKLLLNRSLFINWPMMHEAKVVAVSDMATQVRLVKNKPKVNKLNSVESERWITDSTSMMQGYFAGKSVPGSGGVQIGEVKVRLKLLPLQGMRTDPKTGATKKVFGNEEADVPMQLALWQNPAPDLRFVERGPLSLADRFPVGSNVLLTKGKYTGCLGTVVAVADNKSVGVKVSTMPPEIPFGLALARSLFESYVSSGEAARVLKISPSIFGRIAGSLIVEPGKYDLGLNLKSGDGLYVPGYARPKVDSGKGKKGDGEKKAWNTGDSVLVVGSERAGVRSRESSEERIFWEYTTKAIRLVNEYREKFPQLFAALAKQPNEKKYDATAIFGPNGVEWLPTIRTWLNNVESAKLPRSPTSTETLSKDAVAAVEKAANVLNLAIKKKGYPKDSVVKIPGSALYLENSTGATDVILGGDFNGNAAPELGDRVVNLCANGIPFGARGTVVAIHEDTSGCVEIVLDEEFVGGTSLQGLCSNFRGKLCVWAHLLRITVENSDSMVDKILPRGSGKADVQKILASIEKHSNNQKSTDNPGNNNKSASRNGSSQRANKQGTPKRAPDPTSAVANVPTQGQSVVPASKTGSAPRANRAVSAGKARAGSAGRDKQAGWREASGPPSKNIGFAWTRKAGKSGLNRWKAMVVKQGKTKGKASSGARGTADLKAMLGVTTEDVSRNTVAPKSAELKAMLGVPNSSGQGVTHVAPKTAELKAMLGVSTPVNVTAPVPAGSATEGLKALLGVGPEAPIPVPQPPLPQPVPLPSAADKLFQLMSKSQAPIPPAPIPGQAAFNFTYTEEGKGPPMPAPPMPFTPPPMAFPHPHMAFPPPPPVPMFAHGMVPAMNLPMPNAIFPAMPLNVMPQVVSGPGIVSDDEFPALGAEKKEKPSSGPVQPKKKSSTKGMIVPSTVASRVAEAKS